MPPTQAYDHQETQEIYELVVERHRRVSSVVVSDPEPQEWLAMMADTLLAPSAVDRLLDSTYELVPERRVVSPLPQARTGQQLSAGPRVRCLTPSLVSERRQLERGQQSDRKQPAMKARPRARGPGLISDHPMTSR
jgi:hypothetical protein